MCMTAERKRMCMNIKAVNHQKQHGMIKQQKGNNECEQRVSSVDRLLIKLITLFPALSVSHNKSIV